MNYFPRKQENMSVSLLYMPGDIGIYLLRFNKNDITHLSSMNFPKQMLFFVIKIREIVKKKAS